MFEKIRGLRVTLAFLGPDEYSGSSWMVAYVSVMRFEGWTARGGSQSSLRRSLRAWHDVVRGVLAGVVNQRRDHAKRGS